MQRSWPNHQDYLDAAIKTAQYLASITTQQDVWDEIGKVMINFWHADLIVFGKSRTTGHINLHHFAVRTPEIKAILALSDALNDSLSPFDRHLKELIKRSIDEVLESGFMTWQLVPTPTPMSLVFLPVSDGNGIMTVLVAGYTISEMFPKALLNIYLALAGLISTTVTRLTSEKELSRYRQKLETLVTERTTKLSETNQRLQAEIAERRQAEKALQEQLQEKEILLTETHHRIKNNITAIAGLLSMQKRSTNNTEVKSVLNDAISRVMSIAELYNKMLLSVDYRHILTASYFNDLVDSIIKLFADNPKILITTRFDDFSLDSKKAFLVGIVLNELLTNSVKYAFGGQDAGAVEATLAKNGNQVTLIIEDNGVGIPDGFDIKTSKRFGLTLVRMLAGQLDGSFSIESQQGTKSVLVFDV